MTMTGMTTSHRYRKRPAKGVIDVRRGMTLGVSLGPRRRGRDGGSKASTSARDCAFGSSVNT